MVMKNGLAGLLWRSSTILAVVCGVVLLSGCNTADKIKSGVDEVCGASTTSRDLMKEKVDKITYPHEIRINCYAKAPEESGS
jgi:hypothetical protein